MEVRDDLFELGDLLKDRITLFKGIAEARIEFLNGCVQYKLQAQKLTEEGKIINLWVDEQMLDLVKSKVVQPTITTVTPPAGGERSHPPC